ncbi:hypothetical protein LTR56_020137 [Elasticomyces elasticus]|nr:hypothetical protein LTR56_020137 [Elasticomyces elasticus]KAK3633599.1 hypothetical protein LTR22_020035 [Elasticomyces elasticus]KAK4910792.1 hypothetical protein LTR49_020566 [Elasticomyces elasticus]KAK5760446.1 hypothetical protein LTS12_009490 [Elasticomyces elasticus]
MASPTDLHEASRAIVQTAIGNENGHSDKAKTKTPLELLSQGVCLPGIPQHPTFGEHRQWMLEKMALAFRVFARKGYTAGLAGHISVRDPEWPHTFWMNPLAVHFGLMKVSDMILVDYAGKPIGGNTSSPANGAGFQIHSAIHKRRPDVMAAAHTHSPHGLAWSPFGRRLEMLTQDVAYVYGEAQGVYNDFGGVVFTEEEGVKIGDALGPKGKALILQNHGLVTVGHTVDEACFLMTLVERCCQVQLLADAAAANGLAKTYVSDQAARYTFEHSSTPETLYWEAQPDLEWEAAMSGGAHRG